MQDSWHAVHVELNSDDADLASHLFHLAGCNGVMNDAAAEAGKEGLTAYFSAKTENNKSLKTRLMDIFLSYPCFKDIDFEIVTAATNDWQESFRQWFHPFEIAPNIIITPSWEKTVASRQSLVAGKTSQIITLDPGMAFGTGLHETTKLCAEAICLVLGGVECHREESHRKVERRGDLDVVKKRDCHATKSPHPPFYKGGLVLAMTHKKGEKYPSLLDVGTGSGILALVARKLGIQKIETVENDPDAAKVAAENFEINGETDIKVAANLNDISGQFDIVVANILMLTLIELKSELIAKLKPQVRLILSGITGDQEARIIAAFAPPLKWISTTRKNEWSAIIFEN